jgi:hypothetical protein
VRLCIWESHKDQAIFPEPFSFNPDWFLNEDFNIDQYAPFGLDQHRCPMSDIVVKLCTLFIKSLAESYRIEPVIETTPNRGTYHWQPGKQFTANLIERIPESRWGLDWRISSKISLKFASNFNPHAIFPHQVLADRPCVISNTPNPRNG